MPVRDGVVRDLLTEMSGAKDSKRFQLFVYFFYNGIRPILDLTENLKNINAHKSEKGGYDSQYQHVYRDQGGPSHLNLVSMYNFLKQNVQQSQRTKKRNGQSGVKKIFEWFARERCYCLHH